MQQILIRAPDDAIGFVARDPPVAAAVVATPIAIAEIAALARRDLDAQRGNAIVPSLFSQVSDIRREARRASVEPDVPEDDDFGAAKHADRRDRVVHLVGQPSDIVASANTKILAAIIGVAKEAGAAVGKPIASPALRKSVRWQDEESTGRQQRQRYDTVHADGSLHGSLLPCLGCNYSANAIT